MGFPHINSEVLLRNSDITNEFKIEAYCLGKCQIS